MVRIRYYHFSHYSRLIGADKANRIKLLQVKWYRNATDTAMLHYPPSAEQLYADVLGAVYTLSRKRKQFAIRMREYYTALSPLAGTTVAGTIQSQWTECGEPGWTRTAELVVTTRSGQTIATVRAPSAPPHHVISSYLLEYCYVHPWVVTTQ